MRGTRRKQVDGRLWCRVGVVDGVACSKSGKGAAASVVRYAHECLCSEDHLKIASSEYPQDVCKHAMLVDISHGISALSCRPLSTAVRYFFFPMATCPETRRFRANLDPSSWRSPRNASHLHVGSTAPVVLGARVASTTHFQSVQQFLCCLSQDRSPHV